MAPPPKRKVPPPAPTKMPPATKLPPKKEAAARPKKKFKAQTWDGSADGEKIIIYAESGMGKTTLSAMAPTPVFLGLDDGGRKIKHPLTGEDLIHFPGIETFQDVRDILQSHELFNDFETGVIDTATILQELAEPHIFDTYKLKGGETATSLRQYGWGDGFGHLVETMRLILQDCDALIAKGKNIIILTQLSSPRKANAGGTDFLEEGPSLYHDQRQSVRNSYKEWADHVFKIDCQTRTVGEDRKVKGDMTRAIFVKPEMHFVAKSRTLDHDIISFEAKDDDSLWKFLFPG